MHIDGSKEPYWIHIRWPPPAFDPNHQNWQVQFIQLDPSQNEAATLAEILDRAKSEGRILDYTFQYIERFQSLKAFERRMGKAFKRRVDKKK